MSFLSPMPLWVRGALALTLCAAAATAAPRPQANAAPPAAPARDAFRELPLSHPAYAAVNHLEQAGIFIGYPTGWFSGKRALAPYEFGIAVQRTRQDLQMAVQTLERGAPPVLRSAPSAAQEASFARLVEALRKPGEADRLLTWFEALVVEFGDVLDLLKANRRQMRQEIRQWRETLCADAPGR